MTRRRGRRIRIALVLACALCSLPGLSLVTRALQSGEIFSPASGHAAGHRPGCRTMTDEAAWRVVFHSIDPGGAAELSAGGPGFVLVDTGGVAVEEGERSTLLAPAEASFHATPASRLNPIGDRPAGVFTLDLVSPDAVDDSGDGIPVFASDPFQPPDGTERHRSGARSSGARRVDHGHWQCSASSRPGHAGRGSAPRRPTDRRRA